MHSFNYIIWVILLIPLSIVSQCDNNLIENGSFELDSIGRGKVGKHWIAISGSPDIDNALDSFSFIGHPYPWDGEVLSSSDGGNWQNIAYRESSFGIISIESFGQYVNFPSCVPHIIEFEFTSQLFKYGYPLGSGYSAIDVYYNDDLIYTTKLDSTVFTWEQVSFSFIPNKKNGLIRFEINPDININLNKSKYVAIDGVCIKPIKMGMFCEP